MAVQLSPVELVEAYLAGLRKHDLSDVPFAPDVQFQGPITAGVIVGAEAVRVYLSGQFAITKDIRIQRHIAEGEYIVTLFDFDTVHGVVPVLDLFHIVGGLIRSIRPFFDPGLLRAA